MTIGTTQDERARDASTKPNRTDLGTKRLISIATGAAAIQVTNKFVTWMATLWSRRLWSYRIIAP